MVQDPYQTEPIYDGQPAPAPPPVAAPLAAPTVARIGRFQRSHVLVGAAAVLVAALAVVVFVIGRGPSVSDAVGTWRSSDVSTANAAMSSTLVVASQGTFTLTFTVSVQLPGGDLLGDLGDLGGAGGTGIGTTIVCHGNVTADGDHLVFTSRDGTCGTFLATVDGNKLVLHGSSKDTTTLTRA